MMRAKACSARTRVLSPDEEKRGGGGRHGGWESAAVRVHSDETSVVTEVIDDGAGISRSDVRKIFEPFFTTKPPGRGTGLGLSICHGIVADHGGRVDVDSAPGAGTTFRISLPRHNGVRGIGGAA